MATHSSSLAWEIPRTEEPGGLQSMESQKLDVTQQLDHLTVKIKFVMRILTKPSQKSICVNGLSKKDLYLKITFINGEFINYIYKWQLWDHCLNCEDIINTPILFYAPHCSRQEKVFHCTRKPEDTKTFKSHHKGYTAMRQHTGKSRAKGQLPHWGSDRNTLKLRKMLTLFPTLCLQKSPPGPEWCQPRHLLACLWPCSLCGGKTESF